MRLMIDSFSEEICMFYEVQFITVHNSHDAILDHFFLFMQEMCVEKVET